MLQEAIALHQQGRLAEAGALYRKLLDQNPAHAPALHLLGVIELQTGKPAEAVAMFDRAIAANPNNAAFFSDRGVALQALERYEDAIASFDRALAIAPGHARALSNRGNVLLRLERYEEALASYERALAATPNYAEALNNRGNVLRHLERYEEAIASYDRALALKPDYVEALVNRGVALGGQKRFQDALTSYDRALAIRPEHAEAHISRANALRALKRHDEALVSVEQALAAKPGYADALNTHGNVMLDMERFEEALASFSKALAIEPGSIETQLNCGSANRGLKRFEEALVCYDRVLAADSRNFDASLNRGMALLELKRFDEALTDFDRALTEKPDDARALNYRGTALREMKRYDEALASFDRALQRDPNLHEAFANRAFTLAGLKRLDEALADYDRALAIAPGDPVALLNRGLALLDGERSEEALVWIDRALQIKPDYLEAFASRGAALRKLKRFEEAAASFEAVLRIDPTRKFARGNLLYFRMEACDWSTFLTEAPAIADALLNGEPCCQPFALHAFTDAPEALQRCARMSAGDFKPTAPALWRGERYRHEKIRIGYVSSDFQNHPVMVLTAGIFECHDRNRFETFAISSAPNLDSPLQRRAKTAFDHYLDVRMKTDREIAALLREMEIDIAVDLMGYTSDSRTAVFADRPAPVQVNYLGYPGTMGAGFIDYIVADKTIVPEKHRKFFDEKVVYLPDAYLPNDSTRRIAARTPTRREAGLPEDGFVFCSFNLAYKFNPPVFDIWMRLLDRVPDSVFWLPTSNDAAMRNLKREAQARGIAPERILFAPYVTEAEDHLARLKLADLFLDTLPYNAHSTACDALWAGLPVLTCTGNAFAGRVATSLLNAVGLPEMAAGTLADYEALALRLARDPAALAAIRSKLAANRMTHPLFDTARFTRHLEAAYVQMWERSQRGLPPEAFAVPPNAN